MTSYRLHCFALSGSAYKVALYLNCAGLKWEAVPVDFLKGQTRDPKWRDEINDMGEAPVLEADGKRYSQSGAILSWLAETTVKFVPNGADERYDALRWILFDNHKFTSYFATHRFLNSIAPQAPDPAVLGFLKTRVDAAFAIVEKHLATRKFMLGAKPTIADFSLIGYMYYPSEETGYDLAKSHPAIYAWTQRMRFLPGWKGPYELMPGVRPELRKG
ncbi:MAG TPA: glutathione S-transferase [Hyphomicrobiaceae bacterium]|nr:glutathione S-transferase [Hyphomicrobiaceae bacterium]